MYNALKRLSPILVLVIRAATGQKQPSLETVFAVIMVCFSFPPNPPNLAPGPPSPPFPPHPRSPRLRLRIEAVRRPAPIPALAVHAQIVSGCVVAAAGDLSFDLFGYACALLSCVLQATYLLLVEATQAEKGTSTAELLNYNAILSLPFLLVLTLATGELGRLPAAMGPSVEGAGGAGPFLLLVGLCAGLGVALNYALFFCTVYNSALTTTVVGVMKGVIATLLGFFVLGGVPFHPLNVLGILMNTGGGCWYAAIKYREKQRRTTAVDTSGAAQPARFDETPQGKDQEEPLLPTTKRSGESGESPRREGPRGGGAGGRGGGRRAAGRWRPQGRGCWTASNSWIGRQGFVGSSFDVSD